MSQARLGWAWYCGTETETVNGTGDWAGLGARWQTRAPAG